jgi:hypothetical protein
VVQWPLGDLENLLDLGFEHRVEQHHAGDGMSRCLGRALSVGAGISRVHVEMEGEGYH